MPAVQYNHAREIADQEFLRAVDAAARNRPRFDGSPSWGTRWDVACILGRLDPNVWVDEVPGVPAKVVLAKFRRLQGRGLLTGCDCGCRGDFELTDKGRSAMDAPDDD